MAPRKNIALEIPAEVKQQTLKTLDGLPPIEYLLLCQTPDQVEHWANLKHGYGSLTREFKDYFAGRKRETKDLTPAQKDFYGLLRKYYLAWYEVVQCGWEGIETHFANCKVSLSEELKIGNPGDALIRVLESDCAATMHSSTLPYHRWSPHQTREIARLRRRIEKAKDLGQTRQGDLHKLKNLGVQSEIWAEDFTFLRRVLIAICELQRGDETLELSLEVFRHVSMRLSTNFQSQIHSSKRVSGFEWLNGEKHFLGQHGGVTLHKTSQ